MLSKKNLLGFSMRRALICAFALSLSVWAPAGDSAGEASSKNAKKPAVKKPNETKGKTGLLPKDEPLEIFKSDLSRFQLLTWKIEQANDRKAQLSKSLSLAKKKPTYKQIVDQFLSDRETENLQSQLHLTISETNALRQQKSRLLASIQEKAPAWRKALDPKALALRRSLERNNLQKDVKQKILADAAENTHFMQMLDRIIEDPGRIEEIIQGLPSETTAQKPAGSANSQSTPQKRRNSIVTAISSLEREQEMLLKRWVQNEQSLRRYRSLQNAAGDAAGDEIDQPLFAFGRRESPGTTPPEIPAPLLKPQTAPKAQLPTSETNATK